MSRFLASRLEAAALGVACSGECEWCNAAINSRLYFDQKWESGLDDSDALFPLSSLTLTRLARPSIARALRSTAAQMKTCR